MLRDLDSQFSATIYIKRRDGWEEQSIFNSEIISHLITPTWNICRDEVHMIEVGNKNVGGDAPDQKDN